MLRFGLRGLWSAEGLARRLFRGERARALLAGCAAHSVLPLSALFTAAMGVLFPLTAHLADWPVARGGSRAIPRALAGALEALGGRVETGRRVASLDELPPSRVVLFDTSPEQLAGIAGAALPPGYRRRLARYRYGPGVFKLDWALDGPIPWRDPACLEASTVHVGGTLEEIAHSEREMYAGRPPQRPYLILCQQSQLDETRAPEGKHTGYAYCHVPAGCPVDMSEAIEAQVERFAPGFRDRILARHAMSPAWLEGHNPNFKGGAITGEWPTSSSSGTDRSPDWIPTRRRTRACSSARPRRHPAVAYTASAATGPRSRS